MSLLRDFFDRFFRATAFANIDNLGDALRSMEQRHLAEIELRQIQERQHLALRLSHRPPPVRRRESVAAQRTQAIGKLLAGAH
jgi:hypothetical protein